MIVMYLLVVGLLSCSGAGGGDAKAPPRAPGKQESAAAVPAVEPVAGQAHEATDPAPIQVVREEAPGDLRAAAALLVDETETSPAGLADLLIVLAGSFEGHEAGTAVAILDLVDRTLLEDAVLALLGRAYARAGATGRAAQVADAIEAPASADAVRAAMVGALCAGGDAGAARQILDRVEDPASRDDAIVNLASCEARDGGIDQARDMLDALQDDDGVAPALVTLVEAACEGGHLQGAATLAGGIGDPVHGARAFMVVARSLMDAGDVDGARQALSMGLQEAMKDASSTGPELLGLAEALVAAKDLNAAWTASKAIPDAASRGQGLGAIAVAHAKAGNAYMARKIADVIEDGSTRSAVLGRILAVHVEAGDLDGALDAAKPIRKISEEGFVDALCVIAGGAAQAGDSALADELVILSGSSAGREKLRGCLAVELARAGDAAGAQKYLDLLSGDRSDVMLAMARVLAGRGETKKVLKIADALEGTVRDRAMMHVVRSLVHEGRIEEAFALVPSIGTDVPRARALLVLAGKLASAGEHARAVETTLEASAIGCTIPLDHFWSDMDPFPGKIERVLVHLHGMAQGDQRVSKLQDLVLRMSVPGRVTKPELPDLLALLVEELSRK